VGRDLRGLRGGGEDSSRFQAGSDEVFSVSLSSLRLRREDDVTDGLIEAAQPLGQIVRDRAQLRMLLDEGMFRDVVTEDGGNEGRAIERLVLEVTIDSGLIGCQLALGHARHDSG
jgi:hypothetical protein